MKLTRTSSYAVAALAHMARQGNGSPVPSHVTAAAAGLPERFLLKVLWPLVGVGVLKSVRGPGGGYALARPAKDVTLLEVVEAVDGPIRGDVPEVGKDEAAEFDGLLQQACDAAAVLTRQRLGKVTLAELARGK